MESDFHSIFTVINAAAESCRQVISDDRWHAPGMSRQQLQGEIGAGVHFSGFERNQRMLGVMGLQDVANVTLIRHAYVVSHQRNDGIGGKLIENLRHRTENPVLVRTSKDADMGVKFYEKHGYRMVDEATKTRLLDSYWSIPAHQVDKAVVMGDEKWWSENG